MVSCRTHKFRVSDNSELGRSTKNGRLPYIIGFYKNRKTANAGDVIRVAIAGKPSKAVLLTTRKCKYTMEPQFDNNNIVLVDKDLNPLGTRILCPVPIALRKKELGLAKILALADRFV